MAFYLQPCAEYSNMTDDDLLQVLDGLRNTMVSVSTGGPRINEVEGQFQQAFMEVEAELSARGIKNPLPYRTLWDWHGRWSGGDLPKYRDRREFVASLFNPLINRIRSGRIDDFEPTGWERVDRTVVELSDRLAAAENEEQFQAVGLLCREALISVGQAVFVSELHPTVDGTAASPTDAKRMLEAYIAVELAGGVNEYARKHMRSALDFSVMLQHKRTATFRDAAMCVEATTSVINIVTIVSGRRDRS